MIKPLVLTAACLLLAGCVGGFSGGSRSYANIKPVYQVRNSPIPVPDPRWNPRRTYVKLDTPVARARARAGVTPPRTSPQPTRTSREVTPRRPVQVQNVQATTLDAGGRTVTVRKGDTLYALSRQHGVPVRDLIDSNNLKAPYTLAVGQKISLPSTLVHTVKKGETGYSISRRYGVNLAELMRQNRVRAPYTLSIGQKLTLPGGASITPQSAATPQRPATQQIAQSTPVPIIRPAAKPGTYDAPAARSSSGFGWPMMCVLVVISRCMQHCCG